MNTSQLYELVNKDKRKEVEALLSEGTIDLTRLSAQRQDQFYRAAGTKMFEILLRHGFDVNFNGSVILKKAIHQEASTNARYLQIAEQSGQEIKYPKKFDYSLGGDIKYFLVKKVKILFSLKNYPMVKDDFTGYVGCIGDRYACLPKTENFQKFFDKVCPDEWFVDYLIKEIGWHYRSTQGNLLKELYKRRKAVLPSLNKTQKEALKEVVERYGSSCDLTLLYKFINLGLLERDAFEALAEKKDPVTLSDKEQAFLRKKSLGKLAKVENLTPSWESFETLKWASSEGNTEIVKLLLESGADVNAASKNGNTALMEASLKGHTDIVKLLLDSGADVNAAIMRSTALMYASRKGHTDIVKLLLDKGADMNVAGEWGNTALMQASSEGHIEIVKLLLDSGADVNATNTFGLTALEWASEKGHTETVKVLLEVVSSLL